MWLYKMLVTPLFSYCILTLLQKGLNHKGHEVHKGFLEGSIENLEFQRTIVWKNFVLLCALCGKTGFCSGLIVMRAFGNSFYWPQMNIDAIDLL